MSEPKMMSGAEFKDEFAELLNTLRDDDRVYFGNADLSFARIKERGPVEGPRIVQIAFDEMYNIVRD